MSRTARVRAAEKDPRIDFPSSPVRAAADDGVATVKPDNLIQAVQDAMWQPAYSAEVTA